jgi:hypothetical protein
VSANIYEQEAGVPRQRPLTIIDTPPITSSPEPDFLSDDAEDISGLLGGEGLIDPSETDEKPPEDHEPEPPRSAKKRVSAVDILQLGWYGAGRWGFVETKISPAAGRMMGLQSRQAGIQLDKMIEGTIYDKLVQPIARMYAMVDDDTAIFAAPIMALILEKNDKAAPLFMGTLLEYALDAIVVMGEQTEEEKLERKKKVRSLRSVAPIMGMPDDATDEQLEQGLLNYIFKGAEPDANPEPEPAETQPVE